MTLLINDILAFFRLPYHSHLMEHLKSVVIRFTVYLVHPLLTYEGHSSDILYKTFLRGQLRILLINKILNEVCCHGWLSVAALLQDHHSNKLENSLGEKKKKTIGLTICSFT